MAKATKRTRPGRRVERKSEARFPLRRPALLAALGLAGWAPAGAADFPPTLDLSTLDGRNGFPLNGVAADDFSGRAVSSAGDVNGDGLADLLIGAFGADPNGSNSGASYVVFGRNTAQTSPFPANLNLSDLDGTNGFRLNGVAAYDLSGRAVSSAGDVNGDGGADLLIGTSRADLSGSYSRASYVVFGTRTNSISYANSIRCQDRPIPSPGKGEGEGGGRAPHSSETLNPHPILPPSRGKG